MESCNVEKEGCVDELVKELVAIFRSGVDATDKCPSIEVDVSKVTHVLQKFAASAISNPKAWEKYVYWSEVHYTRNLIFSCDDFEIMLLCWNVNQASRIHNHASSNCWLSVLSGLVSEQVYKPLSQLDDGTLSLTKPFDASSSSSSSSSSQNSEHKCP